MVGAAITGFTFAFAGKKSKEASKTEQPAEPEREPVGTQLARDEWKAAVFPPMFPREFGICYSEASQPEKDAYLRKIYASKNEMNEMSELLNKAGMEDIAYDFHAAYPHAPMHWKTAWEIIRSKLVENTDDTTLDKAVQAFREGPILQRSQISPSFERQQWYKDGLDIKDWRCILKHLPELETACVAELIAEGRLKLLARWMVCSSQPEIYKEALAETSLTYHDLLEQASADDLTQYLSGTRPARASSSMCQ
jgi:hypothetical protein